MKKWLLFPGIGAYRSKHFGSRQTDYRPPRRQRLSTEHTLESKALAFGQGADYLEQDLVMTKDNHLVVIHDHFLDGLTDVAQKFPAARAPTANIMCPIFTLAESARCK